MVSQKSSPSFGCHGFRELTGWRSIPYYDQKARRRSWVRVVNANRGLLHPRFTDLLQPDTEVTPSPNPEALESQGIHRSISRAYLCLSRCGIFLIFFRHVPPLHLHHPRGRILRHVGQLSGLSCIDLKRRSVQSPTLVLKKEVARTISNRNPQHSLHLRPHSPRLRRRPHGPL